MFLARNIIAARQLSYDIMRKTEPEALLVPYNGLYNQILVSSCVGLAVALQNNDLEFRHGWVSRRTSCCTPA